ncbi:hypothetical protein ACFL27_06630 [candidate division CSSED10-310 bacterium]|uniref:Serine/threonine protein kinase n=1 Tax=candidate division CSSED10-310 bacterium TaxID=2855610 RepID=A0ABV6YUW5_UNCC1
MTEPKQIDENNRVGPNRGISLNFPERIGSYRLQSLFGRGGMNVVYKAELVKTGELVALKTKLPQS